MLSKLKLALFLLVFSAAAFGQRTTVSALVQDSAGSPYVKCSVSMDFIGQSTQPGPYLFGGSVFQTSVSANCDGFGTFTAQLPANTAITPTPSQWRFSICSTHGYSPGDQFCFQTLVTITGTAQNISAPLTAAAPILPLGYPFPLTTKGDLFGFNGTGPARVPAGADGDCLVANSASPTGLSYSTSCGSGGGGGGGGVTSINALTGAVSLVAGSNMTITPAGNILTFSSAGGGGIVGSPAVGTQVAGNGAVFFAQQKPSYDTRDQGFVCDGTTNNNGVASTLVASIAGAPANIQFTQQHCGLGDFLFPANIDLDFSPGGSIKMLTDSSTTPGTATFNTGVGAAGHCESNNTTPTCAMPVTATAGDAYVIACMRGFSSGAPTVTSSVNSDIIVPLPGSDPGFTSVTMGWLIPNVTSGARTITATFPANLIGACSAIPVSGLGPTPWLDGSGFVNSNAATASPMSAGPATFLSGSFLIAWGGNNNTAMTCTAGAGFTQPAGNVGNSTNTNSSLCVEYQNSSSAGATTATQSFTVSPAGHNWSYQLLGLRPSSGRAFIQGNIFNPRSAQIFENATGTAGNISFFGSTSPMRVKPEWWGGGSSVAAATNTGAVQAAISAAFPLNGQQYNKVLDLSGGIFQINDETKWYGVRGNGTARFEVDCGAGGGITQTANNKRIMDAQGMAYGTFYNCQWAGAASSTLPLLDIDWTVNVAPSGTLKPQFLDFYTNGFGGNGLVDVGVLIAKSGGAAQGSNINFYDPGFSNFTGSCLQIGGDNVGRNAGRFLATNAIQIGVWGGDMQACPLYGLSVYGGTNITIDSTTMENSTQSFSQQTGFDAYSQNCTGGGLSIDMRNVRSESRRLIAGCNLHVKDSFTVNQAQFPTPGSSFPVGTILMGSSQGGDGKYYRITVDAVPPNLGGVGIASAPQFASGGSATTVANTNETIAGSVTSGTFVAGEALTQGTAGATANLVTTSGAFWITAHGGAPDNSHTWVGGTSGAVFTPTAVPATVNYTVNAFTGFQVTVLSGVNSPCYGVVTSNTANTITITAWLTRFATVVCTAPAASSGYIVEPNWGTQFSSGGITWVDQNENGIEGQSGTGLSSATLENVSVPGNKISFTQPGVYMSNVQVTRADWANLPSGNVYLTGRLVNNKIDAWIGTSASNNGINVFQNWQLPRAGTRTFFNGPFSDLIGARALVWECGDSSGVAGACNDKWIGGVQDSTAGNVFGRNILPFCCLLGPPTPVGTDKNGFGKVGMTGGLSTGAGTPTDLTLMYGTTGGAGTQVNPAADGWLIKGGTGHLFAGTDNTFDIGATGANRPRNIYVATQLISEVVTGTAPLVVASSTNVPNLNASSLNGATFAAPGPIGSGTPSTGAFTTLNVSGVATLGSGATISIFTNTASNSDLAGKLTLGGGGTQTYTFTGTYTTAPICVTTDTTAANAVKASATTTVLTLTGTAGDVLNYICIGLN